MTQNTRTIGGLGGSDPRGVTRGDGGLNDDALLAYGNLSAKVVRSVLVGRAKAALPNRFQFCEIADGPATWSLHVLEEFSNAQGVVVCATDGQAAEAVASRKSAGYTERLRVLAGGLATVADLPCGTFDLAFTLDDLLDVADDPQGILTSLTRITKPGGLVMSLVRNLCEAVSASLADACIEQAEQALTGQGGRAANAAGLNIFTPQSIEELLKKAGAHPLATLGVPAAAPPWRLDARGTRAHCVLQMLSNSDSLKRILGIEQALLDQTGGLARGSHLLSVAAVPSRGTSWGDFWLAELEGGRPAV